MVDFNFRLQRVLDIRDVELEKAQHQLYQVRKVEKEIKKELNHAQKKLSDLFNYIRDNNLSVTENIRIRHYIKKQQHKVKEITDRLYEHKNVVEEQKNILLEKKKSKEKILKIKEKKAEAFYKEFLSKQQKEIDEISLTLSKQGV